MNGRTRIQPGWALLLISVLGSFGCYQSHTTSTTGSGGADGGADVSTPRPDVPSVPEPICVLEKTRELQAAFEDEGNLNALDLFWTGSRVGVIIHEGNENTGAHPLVSVLNVDPELTESTPFRLVGEEAHGWGEAAYHGSGFGLCWSGDPGGMSQMNFREVTGLEGPLGTPRGFGRGTSACLELAFENDRYLVAYRRTDYEAEGNPTATEAAVLRRDGSIGAPEYSSCRVLHVRFELDPAHRSPDREWSAGFGIPAFGAAPRGVDLVLEPRLPSLDPIDDAVP